MQPMDTLKHSGLNLRNLYRRKAAFSLVEVVTSIGIAAFAFISVLGLIPTGLNTFRQAVDTSVGSQIMQRVINEAQQTDFDRLVTDKDGTTITAGTTGLKANRYFEIGRASCRERV